MIQFFLALLLFLKLAYAEEFSSSKYAKLVQKGEKVALKLCDETKLSQIKILNLPDIYQQLEQINPCITLNARNKEALAYFLLAGQSNALHSVKERIDVPKEVKCPVCGMFVAKYPKWVAYIEVEHKKYYFDGVKDMMKFYIFDVDFPYNRNKIEKILVTDFYTLKAIDAKKAFYVVESNLFGPMGNELIPFLTKEAAENFMKDHSGKEIILFDAITPKLVMGLDGIEYRD